MKNEHTTNASLYLLLFVLRELKISQSADYARPGWTDFLLYTPSKSNEIIPRTQHTRL